MGRFRARLRLIAALWLYCHLGLLAVPALTLIAAPSAVLECTCTHGDHAVCPMHHKPAAGSTICLIRSADHASTGVVVSVFTFVGILTTSPQSIAPPALGAPPTVNVSPPSLDSSPPEAPPPRA